MAAQPRVRWEPRPPETPRWSLIGASWGFLVGAIFSVPSIADVVVDLNRAAPSSAWNSTLFVAGTVAAGTLTGWLFGPSIANARSWLYVAILACLQALVAVLVAAMVVGTLLLLPLANNPFVAIGVVLVGWAVGLIGAVFIGLFFLPTTLAAAAVWVVLLRLDRWLRGRRASTT
jgi:hypothetical protein